MSRKFTFLLFLLICLTWRGNAQSDSTIQNCTKYLKTPYISDGQQYKALLIKGEIAEFHTTFYAGNRYRIVSATGSEEGNVIFSVFDKENNKLFSNKDYDFAPYWDFEFEHTINCTIEAQLNDKAVTSGLVYLLIGFFQHSTTQSIAISSNPLPSFK